MWYRAFHRFGQAKSADDVLFLGSIQFTQAAPAASKNNVQFKKVKIDSEIIILLCLSTVNPWHTLLLLKASIF